MLGFELFSLLIFQMSFLWVYATPDYEDLNFLPFYTTLLPGYPISDPRVPKFLNLVMVNLIPFDEKFKLFPKKSEASNFYEA